MTDEAGAGGNTDPGSRQTNPAKPCGFTRQVLGLRGFAGPYHAVYWPAADSHQHEIKNAAHWWLYSLTGHRDSTQVLLVANRFSID